MGVIAWIADQRKRMKLNRIDAATLQRVDRDAYRYQENDHAIIVQVELQCGFPEVIVYAETIKEWLPPHEKEILTDLDKQRILTQVCKSLKKRRISYRVL